MKPCLLRPVGFGLGGVLAMLCSAWLSLASPLAVGATPGQIFQPASGLGQLILDPNGDGFVSASNTGFADDAVDYGVDSEIPYYPLPVLFSEVKNDTRTGSSHTDLIGISVDGYQDPGAFVYNDGANLLFRQRLMDHSTASKGYGFLFDTSEDGKANFEIVLRTGGGQAGITIYDASGQVMGNRIPLSDNFQKSLAAKVNTGSSDEQTYFYDWFLPWEVMPFGPTQNFRGIAFTLTSAVGGYLSGGTIADIAGLDDRLFPNQDLAVMFAINASPTTSGNSLESDGGFAAPVSSVPTINGPVIADNSVVVTGTSAEAAGSTINLSVYADATTKSSSVTGEVGANGAWSITVATLNAGEYLGATAEAPGKSVSGESSRVRVQAVPQEEVVFAPVCTPSVKNSKRSGNNFYGTVPGLVNPTTSSDVTIRLYNILLDGERGSLYASTKSGEGATHHVTYRSQGTSQASNGDFNFELNSPSGNIYVGNFYVTAERSGLCESDINFDGSGTPPSPPVITTAVLAPGTGQTISGTSNTANGTPLTIYKNTDANIIGTTTVQTNNTWSTTLTGSVADGDIVYARVSVSSLFSNQSNSVVVGINQTLPPVITGQYTTASTTINGYTQTGGQTVRVFRNGTQIGSVNSNAFGAWTLNLTALSPVVDLVGGNSLTADAQAAGESRSALSDAVIVASSTTPPSAPTVEGPIEAGQPTIRATGTSGTVEFFADGESIGTTTDSSIELDDNFAADYILQGVAITATNTSGGLTSASSDAVIVQPSANPDSIGLVVTPASPIAGTAVTITANVRDRFGSNMQNRDVTFSRPSGLGDLVGDSVSNRVSDFKGKSNQFGAVSITYQTDAKVGTVTVKGETNPTGEVTFTTVAGPATQIAINDGNDQSAAVGAAVTTAPSVILRDANDNPVSGESVTFAVASGGGSVTEATAVTDASGIATVGSWILGTSAGANTLTATITGSDPTISTTFTATGVVAGPATQIAINAGNNQSATVGQPAGMLISTLAQPSESGFGPGSGTIFAQPLLTNASNEWITEVYFDVRANVGTLTAAIRADNAGVPGELVSTLGSAVVTNGDAFQTARIVADSPLKLNSETRYWITIQGSGSDPQYRQFSTTVFDSGSIWTRPDATTNFASSNGGTSWSSSSVNPLAFGIFTSPTVIVRDASNNVVSGVGVSFAIATGDGSFPESTDPVVVQTNENGIAASPVWTLGTTAGANTLTATSTGLDGSPVTFTATGTSGTATAEQSTLAASMTEGVTADGLDESTLTLTTKDVNGNVVPNQAVFFEITNGEGVLSAAPEGGWITDENGVATATLSSTNAATLTVTGYLGENSSGTSVGTATVEFVPGPLASFEIKDVGGNDIGPQTAGVQFDVRIRALDANDNVVTGFNQTVSLTSSGAFPTQGPTTTGPFTGGVLSSQVVEIINTGNFTLTVSDGSSPEITGTSNVFNVNAGAASAATSTVTASPTSLTANGTATSTLTVQLKDANGNNLTAGGATLTFAALGENQGSIGVVTDNNNGTYTAEYTAGTLAGAVTITPSLDGTAFTNTTSIMLTAGAPDRFLLRASDGTALGPQLRNIPFDLLVQVTDAFGNVVAHSGADTQIALTATGGAVLGALRQAGADPADAPVVATLTAGDSSVLIESVLYTGLSDEAGNDVTLSALGVGGAADAFAGAATLSVRDIILTVAAEDATLVADGTSSTTMTVTLTDALGAPLADQRIRVSTNLGSLLVGTEAIDADGLLTDTNGQVTVTLRAGTVAGSATVTALCPGACPATATVVFTAVTADQATNTSLPIISGDAVFAQTLTTSLGTWTNADDAVFDIQWFRCDANGQNCTAISGATSASYTLGSADIGARLVAAITATVAGQSTAVQSAPTPSVVGPILNEDGELTRPEPGETLILEDGQPIEVVQEISGDWLIRLQGPSGSFATAFGALNDDGEQVTDVDATATVTLFIGEQVFVSGEGFKPGTEVSVWLFSTPTFLGTLPVGADTEFAGNLPVPTTLSPGPHTLQISGISADDRARSIAVGVMVLDRSKLASSYRLQVNNGAGSGDYAPGAEVTIAAALPSSTQVFDRWVGDVNRVANVLKPNTTVSMPNRDITLTATYRNAETGLFTLTVNNGTGGGQYSLGDVVTVSAEPADNGQRFDRWTGDTAGLANPKLPNTTLVMPAANIVLSPQYVQETEADRLPRLLTVNDGTGSGEFVPGRVVLIAADVREGEVFDRWVGDTETVDNVNIPNTTLVMPADPVVLQAKFKPDPNRVVRLTKLSRQVSDTGTSSPQAATGVGRVGALFKRNTDVLARDEVLVLEDDTRVGGLFRLQAPPAPVGFVFDKWVGQVATVDNIHLADTVVYIPDYDIEVVATYKAAGAPSALVVESGSGDGTYAAGTAVTLRAEAQAGRPFKRWEGQTAYVVNVNLPETILNMPAEPVRVRAVYWDVPADQTYPLSITGASGSGDYEAGEMITVTLTATPPDGQGFSRWNGQVGTVENIFAETTRLYMPPNRVSIGATFAPLSVTEDAAPITAAEGEGSVVCADGVCVAEADAGYVFVEWLSCPGTTDGNQCVLDQAVEPVTVSARFVLLQTDVDGAEAVPIPVNRGVSLLALMMLLWWLSMRRLSHLATRS